MSERIGIASGGNWIVDRVKTVDRLPAVGMLGNILHEEFSSGGAPANVLGDLARLKPAFPLAGVGVVGDDPEGRFIREAFESLGVDVSMISTTTEAPTSYTDVMSEKGANARIFYHCRGANALFGPEAIPVESLRCRIFHLGYLLLLDAMDAADDAFGTGAARVLHRLQQAGIRTSVDVVSEEGDRFRTIVPPALKYIDYLILNEIETSRIVGVDVRQPDGKLQGPALVDAVDRLYGYGDMAMVAVHMPEGVYIRDREGVQYSSGSLDLPREFIVGATGAGDAFCAGMLFGLHEGWDYARCARLGSCCAAACLSVPSATGGLRPLNEVMGLAEEYPEQDPPVEV